MFSFSPQDARMKPCRGYLECRSSEFVAWSINIVLFDSVSVSQILCAFFVGVLKLFVWLLLLAAVIKFALFFVFFFYLFLSYFWIYRITAFIHSPMLIYPFFFLFRHKDCLKLLFCSWLYCYVLVFNIFSFTFFKALLWNIIFST